MAEEKRVNFKDSEFMTAREKRLVLANWKTYLKHGLKQKHFTRRLYNHLHLNCGFIAHYNIGGFYATYFEHGADTVEFFKRFCDAASYSWAADYKDLNMAMLEVYQVHQAVIDKRVSQDIDRSLDAIEACIKRARIASDFAREFVSRVRG